MVELIDLSSTIQLACGINFAGAVIMDRHSRFIAEKIEYVHYVRDVVVPRITINKAKEDVVRRAAFAESVIFDARFGSQRFPMRDRIRRLQVLCFLAGAAATLVLSLSAFVKPFQLSPGLAIWLLIALFAPIPLALWDIHLCARKNKPGIEKAQQELQTDVSSALRRSAAVAARSRSRAALLSRKARFRNFRIAGR